MSDDIKNILKRLVTDIVNSRYSEIENRGENGRLSKRDIEHAIEDYPGCISQPPDAAYDDIYVYDIYDNKNQARKVEFDLWFDNVRSDLTLSVDVHIDQRSMKLAISIDDIHVL